MKKTILIFGVSSFVGSNLLEGLRDEYRIVGTYHDTPVEIRGITCLHCDVLRKDSVTNLIARIRPDITIYAVGLSTLEGCQSSPKQADALNSGGAMNCCIASERFNSKFIYLSSAFVLGGDDMLYREGETPFPKTVYGTTLSTTEFYVQRSCLNYLILRCSVLYGRSFNPKRIHWFEELQASLAKGEAVGVDDSVVTGFLDVQILVKVLKAAIKGSITNRLLHVSSRDFMTRYEFAKNYARIFHKDEFLIQKVANPLPHDKKRGNEQAGPQYFRLDTSNIEEYLNAKMPGILDSLNLTYKRFKSVDLA